MPIHDFQCKTCGQEFEAVVRAQDTAECPACHGRDLEKRLSSFAVATPEKRREIAHRQVKNAAKVERAIQAERDRDAERHRHEEH
jgi:putative FmdB family regulatory protein